MPINPRATNATLLKIIGDVIPQGSLQAQAMDILWHRLVTIPQTKLKPSWMKPTAEEELTGRLDQEEAQEGDIARHMITLGRKAIKRRDLQQRMSNIASFKRNPGAFAAAIERMLANGRIREIKTSVYDLVT